MKDYTELMNADRYDLVSNDDNSEMEFVVGTAYQWGELMDALIDWNKLVGNEERAAYLMICKDDKAYYFSDI